MRLHKLFWYNLKNSAMFYHIKKALYNIPFLYKIFVPLILFFIILLLLLIKPNKKISRTYIIQFNKNQVEQFQKKVLRMKWKKIQPKIYIVKKGDNFWTIAKTNHIDINTIVGVNPYFNDLLARVNQKIILVSHRGAFHIVRKGETLHSIAKLYNISQSKILKFNRLSLFRTVHPKQILFISEAIPKMLTKNMNYEYSLRKIFISPIQGKYTSGFGWRIHPVTKKRTFHKGLDFRARVGTSVHAAASGIVTFSGQMNGYGKVVVIRHNKTYETLYAHNSKLYVRAGQKVRQGQIIAKSGKTGRVTGPHLHFEVHKNGKPVNPAVYLW